MSYLEIENLSFSYGKREIFRDVCLSADPGEIFCLTGPNGCGKTTLQHCILGRLKPQSGSISINGRSLSDYAPRELAAETAYVPQNHTRAFPYRVLDVVAMGRLRNRRLSSGREDSEKAVQVLGELGMEELAEKEYTALSGGELQMVLVARALCQDSRILILDEPAAHLDIKHSQRILNLLCRISRQRGKMIIMSTHDFNHPLLMADSGANVRMALMHGGSLGPAERPEKLLSSGSLQEVYGIESRLLSVDGQRHFLAAWSREDGR